MADKAKAKPKKKPFLTVGVPGARRTMGGGTSGGGSPVFQPNIGSPKPVVHPVKPIAGPSPARTLPGGSASPGRPPTNLGKYLVKPTDTTVEGYEMLNDSPDLLAQVNAKFMKRFELPIHLRPTRFLSPELDHGRAMAISRGWRAPRSRSR
jgi:hypothetical protein